jgi:hypothetical protein
MDFIYYTLILGLALFCAPYLFDWMNHKPKKFEEDPKYKHYEPLIKFGDSGVEILVKGSVEMTINNLRSAHFYWANEVNIWTSTIFTFQLQLKMIKMLEKAREKTNNGVSDEQIKEDVRKIIKHYHLEVIKVYPELKEY